MLELRDIVKDYSVADQKVRALKGVSLAFRESEFVSILGQSGCGKTTLLNIIGGLDHYTSGDLKIDGVSTKEYNDRDWDTYRNHRIGFVFQSYNLIPHQTIAENVELALNISGVERAERIKRAKEALDQVGLQGLYNKKPNQLSGGQMQRVAIARALVNNPEILLADEPTGALDSETSVQIMELIHELSKKCLVIMVTHNPDLAEKYSSRIIRLFDGEVTDDSNPPSKAELESAAKEPAKGSADKAAEDVVGPAEGDAEDAFESDGKIDGGKREKKKSKSKKSKLSFWSAFRLSAKNLWSKLKRTILVCFAGSIGIIGVASVLAVSNGVKVYINDMQNDMLSGNPIQISTEALDMESLMSGMSDGDKQEIVKASVEKGKINVERLIQMLVNRGDAASASIIQNNITNEYLDYVKAMPKSYYKSITAKYGINTLNNIYTDYTMEGEIEPVKMSFTTALAVYTDVLGMTEFKSYASYIPMFTSSFKQAPSDVDFISSQYDIISDPAKSKIATEKDEIMIVVSDDSALTDLMLAQFGYFTQNEFLNHAYKAVNDEKYDESLWKEKFTYDELMNKKFTWYPNDTVFKETTVMGLQPGTMVPVQQDGFKYNSIVDDTFSDGVDLKVTAILKRKSGVKYGSLATGFYYTEKFTEMFIESGKQSKIVKSLHDQDKSSYQSVVYNGAKLGITFDYHYTYAGVRTDGRGVIGSQNMFTSMMNMMAGAMGGGSLAQDTQVYTITDRELGGLDTPSDISVYPTDFKWKANVRSYLDRWNGDGDIVVGDKTIARADREDIKYTDNLQLIISMISTLINVITVALVAFTSLALVVSTVMIAIITYVSVMERVKEIGVIRSLGGRKRDVSALFNAETFIIGGISGVIGIGVTYIIQGILNLILGNKFGIYTIAALPIPTALIMIAVSIILTLISGLIPAALAAKKDPVVALRTE